VSAGPWRLPFATPFLMVSRMVNSSTPSALSLAACSELKPSPVCDDNKIGCSLTWALVYGWRNTGSRWPRSRESVPGVGDKLEHLIGGGQRRVRLGRRTEEIVELLVRARLAPPSPAGRRSEAQAQRHP